MTLQEILTDIPRLTTREQLLLLEALCRSLHEDLDGSTTPRSAERLLGIIKTNETVNDEDVEHIRLEHVLEKYS